MSMNYAALKLRAKRILKPFLAEAVERTQQAQVVAVETAETLGLTKIASVLAGSPRDLVISPNEISYAHGTGVLLSRLLEGRSDIIVARSATTYGGTQEVSPASAHVLSSKELSWPKVIEEVQSWVANENIRSILCVPYFESDLQMALAAKAITKAPLGLWIMDDNALFETGISHQVLNEALGAADAVFAISPELRNAYETHSRRKIWLLPPMAAAKFIREKPSKAAEPATKGVMIGNVWRQQWLDDLGKELVASGQEITWFSSNSEVGWLSVAKGGPQSNGITFEVAPAHEELVERVTNAPFVIVPTSKLDGADPNGQSLGKLSLPTRMPFVLASSGTPIIVVGSPDTAAARFVARFGLGAVVPYDGAAIKQAIAEVSSPRRQATIRARAHDLSRKFSFEGASDLVFNTIRNGGRLSDRRFEDLFGKDEGVFRFFVPEPVPPHIGHDFRDVYHFSKRLKSLGFAPDFIIDVGASTGIWSLAVAEIFPDPKYVLCDPMFSRYEHNWAKPTMKRLEVAVSDRKGTASFKVSGNLYNSSLLEITGIDSIQDTVSVPVKTIDQIVREENLEGRGLLKVDVQFAEHLVVAGAIDALKTKIDVVILELTLARVHPEAKTLLEVSNQMDQLGFRLFDTVGEWRTPATGELEQLDLAFVRRGLAENGFKSS
jgi:FkbM family methyltransferase